MGDADVCVCFRVFIESINEESRSRAAVRLQSHKKMSETCDSRDTNHRPPLPKPTVDDHFIRPPPERLSKSNLQNECGRGTAEPGGLKNTFWVCVQAQRLSSGLRSGGKEKGEKRSQ